MMEEKIELFNNAINEKTNEIDKKIEELKFNKETAVEKLLKDKEDLENEIEKLNRFIKPVIYSNTKLPIGNIIADFKLDFK